MSTKQVTLTMSEAHAKILLRALDLFSRVGIGQFEECLDVYDRDVKLDHSQRECLREHLDRAKESVGHPRSGSYGIHNKKVNDDFRVAYDIQQVVRNKLAWARNPKGGIQVHFDEPRQTSRLPLTFCEVNEEKVEE